MKLRYRIIGILLLIGIYFGYREDPREQYVMVYLANRSETKIPFPVKIREMVWTTSYSSNLRRMYHNTPLGKNGSVYFVPADIESAEKIEAYLDSR